MIRAKTYEPWTPELISKLIEMYPKPTVSPQDLRTAFPMFNMRKLQDQARRLNLTRPKVGEVMRCHKCNRSYDPSSEIVFCDSCGKRVRSRRRPDTGSHAKRRDYPESTAIPLAERNQL
jgi:hypothetical protein